jgi:hypothetical protein
MILNKTTSTFILMINEQVNTYSSQHRELFPKQTLSSIAQNSNHASFQLKFFYPFANTIPNKHMYI